jgi:membrane protease YdiL (CAAX protease family)
VSGLAVVLTGWAVLLAGHVLVPRLGRDGAVLIAFALATALVWAQRRGDFPGRYRSTRPFSREATAAALALAAGFASLPLWLAGIRTLGLAVGLAPRSVATPPEGTPSGWVTTVVLAPLFEEALYRERLLGTLRPRVGTVAAVVLSSTAFALPHAYPWSLLGTFLVGLGLALAACLWCSLPVCIALHAGLNLAVAQRGVPPTGFPWPPALDAAGVAVALLAIAWLLRRDAPVRLPREPLSPGTERG